MARVFSVEHTYTHSLSTNLRLVIPVVRSLLSLTPIRPRGGDERSSFSYDWVSASPGNHPTTQFDHLVQIVAKH